MVEVVHVELRKEIGARIVIASSRTGTGRGLATELGKERAEIISIARAGPVAVRHVIIRHVAVDRRLSRHVPVDLGGPDGGLNVTGWGGRQKKRSGFRPFLIDDNVCGSCRSKSKLAGSKMLRQTGHPQPRPRAEKKWRKVIFLGRRKESSVVSRQ